MSRPNAQARYKCGDDDGYGEVLTEFPRADAWERHPWGVWRDGKVRVLQRGRHFDAESAAGMRSTVYAYARRHGLTVRVQLGRPSEEPGGRTVFCDTDRFLTLWFPQDDTPG